MSREVVRGGGARRGTIRRGSGHRRGLPRLPWVAGVLALALALGAVALLAGGTPVARADSTGSLTIVIPQPPTGGQVQGPVGTNVTIQGAGLTAGNAYQLGVATIDAGCSGGFQPLSAAPITIGPDGTLAKTFAWPQNASAIGTSYYICAEDTSANPPVQSQDFFTVLAATPPVIHVEAVPQPTAGPGTPPAPTPKGYYAGEQVTITGDSFLPGGQNLTVYMLTSKITTGADLAAGVQLQTVDGSAITPDTTGHFSTTVTLPGAPQVQTGKHLFLYVVSGDGTADGPPSLAAFREITLQPAPTPVPTATSVPTVAPTATTQGGGGTTTTGGGSPYTGAIIGLGALSVVLFLIGVILLGSAAAMPRQ
jgi:hypothetical protein